MRNFQAKPSLILLLLALFSCEKEPISDKAPDAANLLQEHIFNGKTQWTVSHMEADREREINGIMTRTWSEAFPECRSDNVYQFGEIPIQVASIHLDESSHSCDPEEPDYVSQGFFLEFSSDFTKAAVSIRAAAMAKLFHLPYDSRIKLNGFRHTWQFEEISRETLIIKALIPADESGGMVEEATEVNITFKRHQ
jgi:hypothetical protein